MSDNNLYLAHHGVKGQRWGVRRYQNENGEYTTEGRLHYGYGVSNNQRRTNPSFFQRRKMKKAAKVYNRLDSFSDRRKKLMSKRQRISYEKSKQYWGEVSRGITPIEKRGFIKRLDDKYRSQSMVKRTAGVAAFNYTINSGIHAFRKMFDVTYDKKYGEIVTTTAFETGTDMVGEELLQRVFGHY